MAVEAHCPGCGHLRFVSEHRLGEQITCSKCGESFRVPRPFDGRDDEIPVIRVPPHYPVHGESVPNHHPPPPPEPLDQKLTPHGRLASGLGHFQLRYWLVAICFVTRLVAENLDGPFPADLQPLRVLVVWLTIALILFLGLRGAFLCSRCPPDWERVRSLSQRLFLREIVFAAFFAIFTWPVGETQAAILGSAHIIGLVLAERVVIVLGMLSVVSLFLFLSAQYQMFVVVRAIAQELERSHLEAKVLASRARIAGLAIPTLTLLLAATLFIIYASAPFGMRRNAFDVDTIQFVARFFLSLFAAAFVWGSMTLGFVRWMVRELDRRK